VRQAPAISIAAMQPHTDELRVASFADLDTRTLYELLKLRCEVFVVEQASAYLDVDGHDMDPAARHVWVARAGEPVAYLRILGAHDGTQRIGRVVVAKSARGDGLAGRLMDEAIGIVGNRPAVLDAQTPLVGFYERYGFTAGGPEFLDGGVPHVPMARPAR
jgi:ElaA protein